MNTCKHLTHVGQTLLFTKFCLNDTFKLKGGRNVKYDPHDMNNIKEK